MKQMNQMQQMWRQPSDQEGDLEMEQQPPGRSWDSFFNNGLAVSVDYLANRAEQKLPEGESLPGNAFRSCQGGPW